IGKPLLEIELAGGYIASVTVLRSAPCGETWYLAQRIKWKKINPREELYDVIAKAHHTYPCTASMEVDPEIGEPILHEGGYVAREAVEKAIEEALKRRQRT
ncbi:MAG: thymidylate synthase, partial [Thermoproteota archaeon]